MSRFPIRSALVVVLVAAGAGCGSNSAKDFGGEETGGAGGPGGTSGTGGAMGRTGGATGSGGSGAVTGSGGTDGSGGRAATGGTPGSGGMMSMGGQGGAGTGGRANTGGAPGTGGRVATGGAPGTGGRAATGGAPGSGGAGGQAAICDQIAANYQKELPAARACTLQAQLRQCQAQMPRGLGCQSNCMIYVQTPEKLIGIRETWDANKCEMLIQICPAIVCVPGEAGHCFVAGTSTTPECQTRAMGLP